MSVGDSLPTLNETGYQPMEATMSSNHNSIARDLRTPKYRKRIVRSRKVYSRKAKHKIERG